MFAVKISPSRLEYLESCPVFWQEPRTEKHQAAEEGDMLHEAVERGDPSLVDNEEQKTAVKECIEYVRNLAPHPNDAPSSSVPMVERDVVFKEYWLESDIGKKGRADLVIFPAKDRSAAHVVDYKFGKAPVEHASKNAQGIDYAYRVFWKFPEIQKVTVHFIMPRQRDVTWHEFSRSDDYPRIRQRLLRIHEQVNDPFKKPTPNFEKACQYCDLKARCPALGENAVQLARQFSLLPVPEDFAPHAPRTPEERGMAQDLADLFMKWGEEVKKQNTQSVLGGEAADGYKVQSRKGNTSVRDSLGFVSYLSRNFDISTDEVIDKASSISFSKVVSLLKEHCPDVDASQLREKLESELGHLINIGPQISFLAKERKGKRKEVPKEEKEKARQLVEQVLNAQEQ